METCSVSGCDRDRYCRGMCLVHYTRVRRNGEPGPARVWDKSADRRCTVSDCSNKHYGNGLCWTHWLRVKRHGDVAACTPRKGPGSVRWLDRESLNYDAAHDRVKRERGAPSRHLCRCGAQAEDWAYQHTDDDPLRDDRGRPFTDDVWAYAPMCRSCHKALDWSIKKAVNTP